MEANGARVVCLSSQEHCFSGVLEEYNFESRAYDSLQANAQATTVSALFAPVSKVVISTDLGRLHRRKVTCPIWKATTNEIRRWAH
jgi:hypothetical protein